MFLWLGNYSMGQAANCSDSITYCDPATQECNCNAYNAWSSTFCNCVAKSDNNSQTSTPCTQGDLANDPNAITSSIGIWCVCKDWWKRVGKQCKDCSLPDVCCGVELNTNVPFIGKCLEDEQYAEQDPTVVSQERAFPVLMGSLTQILVTVILIVSFVLIVVGGIMIATGNPKGGKDLLMKVVIGIALLGASWVILRLINPNFFG